jgi:sigma-B regulation protein RsbU (phosphoserine phosphatase)
MPISLAWVQTPAALDEIERQLLQIWSSHVATSIDNVEKYKLMDSLEHARKIQESMLPTDFAGAGARFAVDVYARLTPAKEVSGDLYDVFAVQDGGLCLLVGDVSDKGVPSALFMAMTRTLIRSAMKTERAPQRVLRRVNQELCQDNDMAMFVTLFLAIYYPDNGQLVYANAGHNPPYVLRGGGAIELIPSHEDIALGVLPDIDYAQAELSLQRGDGLLLFTDGVTEACDIDAQLFGETRLERALQDLHQAPAEAVVNGVFDRVGAFVRGAAQSDDTTVLCLRRRSV